MRNHKNLEAFHLSDDLAISTYDVIKYFPKEERYALTSQIRRSAISIPSNIVEGCARKSEADFLRFIDIAYGSTCELQYQLSISFRLGYIQEHKYTEINELCKRTAQVLNALICSFRRKTEDERL